MNEQRARRGPPPAPSVAPLPLSAPSPDNDTAHSENHCFTVRAPVSVEANFFSQNPKKHRVRGEVPIETFVMTTFRLDGLVVQCRGARGMIGRLKPKHYEGILGLRGETLAFDRVRYGPA
jgi:hypothetical protein